MSAAVEQPAMDLDPAPPKDANDYSRFDDVGDDSSDSDDGKDLPSTVTHTAAESIVLANASKEEGNNAFKAGQYVEGKETHHNSI